MKILSAPLLAGTPMQAQIDLETQAAEEGSRRYDALAKEAVDRGDGASLKPAERLMVHWHREVAAGIRAHQRNIETGGSFVGKGAAGPPTLAVGADKLAVIVMHEALGHCLREPAGATFTSVAIAVGRSVLAEISMSLLAKEKWTHPIYGEKSLQRKMLQRFKNLNPERVNWYARKNLSDRMTHMRASVHVGVSLLWVLMDRATLTDNQGKVHLAFVRETRRTGIETRYMLKMTDAVRDVIQQGHVERKYLRPNYLPMIIEPLPWLQAKPNDRRTEMGAIGGGYIATRTPLISKPTRDQKRAVRSANMGTVYECLNALTKTPWRINERVLAVMQAMAEAGGGVAGLPPARDRPMPPRVPDDQPPDVVKKAKAERSAVHAFNIAAQSERCDFGRMMLVADRFRGRPMYFPHQLDYRSRAYPIPQHLNHQGDDVRRGLLEFDRPVVAGAEGDRWLKIHAANCYGAEKGTFEARVNWVDRHSVEIVRTLRDPMKCEWWLGADDPWQFLAACYAMDNADAAMRVPVGMDGSANGLQWYTAMGRDELTAPLVNIAASGAPGDVYSMVAKQVSTMLRGSEAESLTEWVNRKTVKQPVMTTVYGVTPRGATEQVNARLLEAGFDRNHSYKAASALARIILTGIGQVCPSAKVIMDWIRASATLILHETKEPVRWTTPIGFPVVQPQRNMGSVTVPTLMHSVQLAWDNPDAPVSITRQRNAAAPNFVHSLDSTHMLLTAREMRDSGMDFAAVHDSYMTQPGNVASMNRILREKFVEVNAVPQHHRLADEWREIYPTVDFPEPPRVGKLDIYEVLRSPYFFG